MAKSPARTAARRRPASARRVSITAKREKPATPKRTHSAMHVLSPHLVCRDAAKAIDFYKRAFGAKVLMRLPAKDGKLMHASLIINGSSVMLMDEAPDWGTVSPQTLKGTPVTLHLVVADVDAAYARAVKAGATGVMAPADMFWGDRYAVITDPFGHSWAFAKPLRIMTEAEIRAAAKAAMGG